MEENQTRPSHKVYIHNRRGMKLSGVNEVVSFDAQEVLLETEQGMLMVKGMDLHVNRLNLEKGEVDLSGNIDSVAYSEAGSRGKNGESLFGKLFR